MPVVRNEVSVGSQVLSWVLQVPASKEPVFCREGPCTRQPCVLRGAVWKTGSHGRPGWGQRCFSAWAGADLSEVAFELTWMRRSLPLQRTWGQPSKLEEMVSAEAL